MTKVKWIVGVVSLLLVLQGTARSQTFEFQDGDRVVFMGDSNTGGNTFIQTAEIYTLLRFPTRTVRFFNAGKGGDTAPGGAAHLRPDTLRKNPTAVVVTYGAADMLGCFAPGVDKPSCLSTAQTTFLAGIESIIAQCQAQVPPVRVYVSSYPVLGLGQEFNDTLKEWGIFAMWIALVRGERIADVHANMRAVVGSAPAAPTTCAVSNLYNFPDFVPGLHLSDSGHNAWAYSLLKGLNAPAEVSTVTVNAATLTGTATGGAVVSNITGNTAEVHFNRLDPGLPFTVGPPGMLLTLGFVPWHNVNSYRLKVTNLQAGSYELRVEGRSLGQLSHTALANGHHIANLWGDVNAEGGPWNVQGSAIRSVLMSRPPATAAEGLTSQLTGSPNFALLQTLHGDMQDTLDDVLHASAMPWNYAFEVRRVGP